MRTEAPLDRPCALGAEVELVTIPGAAHDDIRLRAGSGVMAPWIAARFAGEPVGSSCAASR